MRIQSVSIRNFRSCEDVRLELGPLTAIVGANGCGKSAALRALDLFYAPSVRVTAEDFYAHDVSRTISIEVTYSQLSPQELNLFSAYVVGTTLSVVKEIRWVNGKASAKIHGSRPSNPAFLSVRGQAAAPARAAYLALKNGDYPELPTATTLTAINAALDEWEAANPTLCSRMLDDGAFFGFDNVGRGNLAKATRMLFVPAVRDAAADALDGKGSMIAELVDLVVRRAMAERDDFRDLTSQVRTMHRDLLASDSNSGVATLGGRLTQTLKTYVPDASVDIQWEAPQFDLPSPRASVRVAEDGFHTNVAACGHGLQRAFIMSLLQELTTAQSSAGAPAPGDGGGIDAAETTVSTPAMVLVIEEPELFQHPSRQRHLAAILARLAEAGIAGAGTRVQVVYCTHSPHFVGVDRFDEVRVFRRSGVAGEGLPKITKVSSTTMQTVAERIAAAKDESGSTAEGLRARLVPIMTPETSEAFFADLAVLVEGDGDRAAIIGSAARVGIDLEGAGIAVIPCSGKPNVLTVAALLKELGVATYCVWDGDSGKGKAEENEALFRMLDLIPVAFPPTTVAGTFACFNTVLEDTLKTEIGPDLFGECLTQAKAQCGMSGRSSAIKNPHVLARVLAMAAEAGKRSETLEAIVDRVVALRGGGPVAGDVPS
jgi:putative ATP-dependent endonuclease of OLD family